MSNNTLLLLIPWMMSFVFLLVAVILLVVVPLRMKKNTAVCTVPVTARIVNFIKDHFDNRADSFRAPMYAPVYEFLYNGEVQSVASHLYSNKKPNIGEVRTLMIDPQNVSHFYDPSTRGRTKLITTIVGVAMLVMGMIAVIAGILLVPVFQSF